MTYYRDDEYPIPVIEPCPYCEQGEVRVGDALALCGMCAGQGRIVTERYSPNY